MRQFLIIDPEYLSNAYYLLGIYHFLGIFDKLKTKEETNQLPEKYKKPLTDLFKILSSELKTSGIPQEQCDRITANVLVTLRKNSSISLEFLEKLVASK